MFYSCAKLPLGIVALSWFWKQQISRLSNAIDATDLLLNDGLTALCLVGRWAEISGTGGLSILVRLRINAGSNYPPKKLLPDILGTRSEVGNAFGPRKAQ